jgi:hypothetical protein
MNGHPCSVALALAALAVARPASAQVFSNSSTNSQSADCHGLLLVAASGVPNENLHKYRFHGTCKMLDVTSTKDYVVGVKTGSSQSSDVVGSVWAETAVSWDRATGELRESVKLQGQTSDTINMVLKCASDPVVGKPSCVQVRYRNETGWAGFDGAWNDSRPISAGKTTLAAATALSAKAGAPNAPPPPPPPPPVAGKTMHSMAVKGLLVEGELLIPGSPAAGPAAVRQEMSPFGKMWSGSAQLFWPATRVGAQLRLLVFIPKGGRYRLSAMYTKAPDYGAIAASVDGHPSAKFDGYAPSVVRQRALLGTYDLTAGMHEVLIVVTGRSRVSRGYYVGLDRLELETIP